MFKKFLWGAIFVSLILIGCAGTGEQIYQSNPAMQTVSTQHYEVTLEPMRAEGYNYFNQFRLSFTNKTNGDLIIDWSETYYLQNGKRYGNFGWIGLTFEELRGLREEPDVTVAAGQSHTVDVFPLQLIGWREEAVAKQDTTPEAGFTYGVIPAGENGMSIAFLKDGKVLRKRVLVTITQE
ncbi:MAG: hypothetical protein JRF38_17530 [Deltaproteobacteria bacterium]|jgi:hypothetical protein|nr:hypothetical protein [Deltaproteobacteria bacterium]